MNDLGDLADAGAGGARDQNLGRGAGSLAHLVAQRVAGSRSAENQPCRRVAGLQLLFQATVLQKPEGSAIHGRHRHGDIPFAGQQDHRQIGINLVRVIQQEEPVAPRHPDIGQDHPVEGRCDMILGLDEGPGCHRVEIRQLQRLGQRLSHGGIIVYDQDFAGHGPIMRMRDAASSQKASGLASRAM